MVAMFIVGRIPDLTKALNFSKEYPTLILTLYIVLNDYEHVFVPVS